MKQIDKLKANFKAIKTSWEINKSGFPLTEERINILNKFTGWGRCNALLYPLNVEWKNIEKISKEDLSLEKEVKKGFNFLKETFGENLANKMWESIKNAILTSFYTPKEIPNAFFEELKKQNPNKQIEMLEPSAGSGIYIDACLNHFPDAKITAVEKDLLTSFLLKAKYANNENVTIHQKGLEEVNFQNKQFDVIASNIPFGDFNVAYTQDTKEKYPKIITNKIHNFFFYHSQNLLKENGILSFITSTGVFNSMENQPVRQKLLEEGKILDLKVLPNYTFEDTEVASHLVTYIKNNENHLEKQPNFLTTSIDSNGVQLNNIFISDDKNKYFLAPPILSTNAFGKPEYNSKTENFDECIDKIKKDYEQINFEINTIKNEQEEGLKPLPYPNKKVATLNSSEKKLIEELEFIHKKSIPDNINNFKVIANIRGEIGADKTIPIITIATGIEKGEKKYYIQSDLKGISFTNSNEKWINSDEIRQVMQEIFEGIENLSQDKQMKISLDFRRDIDGDKFNKFFSENYKHVKLEYGYTKKINFNFHREIKVKDIFVTQKGNIGQIEDIIAEASQEFPNNNESYKIKHIQVEEQDKQKLVDLLLLYSKYNVYIEKHFEYKKGVEWKLEELEAGQKEINLLYDNFVSKYGDINLSNKAFFNKYKDILLDMTSILRGLEVYQEEIIDPNLGEEKNNVREYYTKSGIFFYDYKKEFNEVITTDVALVKSFSQKGEIDISYMAQITGKEEENIINEISEIVIYNPLKKEYELKEVFLQGDLYNKKEKLEALPDSNSKTEALELINQYFPEKISFYEIKYQFGSRWFPLDIYRDFIYEQLKTNFDIHYDAQTDNFLIKFYESFLNKDYFLKKKLGNGKYFTSEDIIKYAFYGTYPEITKTEKFQNFERKYVLYEDTEYCKRQINNFKEKFIKYINNLPNEKKEEIEYIYNKKFNYLAKDVDIKNSFFKLGINKENLGIEKEYPHQIQGVWKMLLNNGGIIDHEVGYGKTISLIALAHNLKKFKKAKTPLILGLPSNISEIAKRYQQAFPQDRILYAGKEEFSVENRELFFNQLRNNEYDVVIMSHEQFKNIPISDEIYFEETQKKIQDLEHNYLMAKENNLSIKDLKNLQKSISNLKNKEQELKERLEKNKNNNIPHIGNLGIDHIIVDESHLFKNGDFTTRHVRTRGIGQTEGSKRASALKMAIRSIQKNNNSDFGATFFSGTPISNALSELYILQDYLMPNMLNEKGISNFDAWASTFMLKSQEIESNIVGEAVTTERFRKYMNIPELSKMYRSMTHTMRGDSEFVKRPKQDVKMLVNELTPQQKKFNAKLLNLMKKGGSIQAEKKLKLQEELKRDELGNVNALSLLITNLALKSSLDMRLINRNIKDDPNSKVNIMLKDALDRYKRYNKMKGTQIIFCDIGISNKKLSYEEMDYNYKNNIFTGLYDDIKYKLIRAGIPENEIAFIQDYNTDKKKIELSKLMNSGKIRFLIGGIKNAGTGINVQKKLCGVTHFTLPWRPSDLEQGNGRIFRAGNEIARLMNDNKCEITMCATNGTLDSYKTEFLRRKIIFINQIREGANNNVRIIDEGEMGENLALDLATLQAELAGDKTILEKAKVDKELEEINRIISNFDIQRSKAQDKYNRNVKDRDNKQKVISYLERDKQKAEKLIEYKGDKKINKPQIPELGEIFNEKILAEFIQRKIEEVGELPIGATLKVGELYDFDMILKRNFNGVSASIQSKDSPIIEYENNYINNLLEKYLSNTVLCNIFLNCFNVIDRRIAENSRALKKYDDEVKSAEMELKEMLSEEIIEKQKQLIEKQAELDKKLKETGGLRTKADYEIIQEKIGEEIIYVTKITEDLKELERAILYDQFGEEGKTSHIYIPDENTLNLFQKFDNNGITINQKPLWNDQIQSYYLNFTIENIDLWYEKFINIINPREEVLEDFYLSPFEQENKELEIKNTKEDLYKIDNNGQLSFSFDNLNDNPKEDENIKKEIEEAIKRKDLINKRNEITEEIEHTYEEGQGETIFEKAQEESILLPLPNLSKKEKIIDNNDEKYNDIPELGYTDGLSKKDVLVYKAYYIPSVNAVWYVNELEKETGVAFGLVAFEDVEWGYFSINQLLEMGAQEVVLEKNFPLTYGELLDIELVNNLTAKELEKAFNGELLYEKDRWKQLPDTEEVIEEKEELNNLNSNKLNDEENEINWEREENPEEKNIIQKKKYNF